jgi:hypothetical protein
MNIAEIRQKYPQYNDLSDMELAQGLHKKFYSDMDFNDFTQKIGVKTSELNPLTEEQKAKPKENYLDGVATEGLKGFGQGIVSGLGRYASGLTLGATDWIDRKTGGNLKALEEDLAQSAKNAGVGSANEVAKFAAESGGMLRGVGNKILKGAKTLPEMVAKGGIEGGIYGATASDNLQELPNNILGGAVLGGGTAGVLGGIGRTVRRLVPALNAEGKAKSLKDAFSDRESTIALKRGAKASQKISDKISQEMPVIKDEINSKMDSFVTDTIGETPNINELVNTAKANYTDYMVHNAGRPVDLTPIKNNYKNYTKLEKKTLKDAFANANFETNSPVGTVEHAHQMRMAVDDMIDAATKKSNNRYVPKLMKVREDLDKVLKSDDGYKAIDDQYAQAMKVQEAYDKGFSATKKSKKPVFENEMQRKAWLSGANENLQNNLANGDSNYAKTVSNNLSLLKNGLNADEFRSLKRASNSINKEYSRAAGLDKIVNKESAAENRPFWREILESVGSTIGAGVGMGERALYGLSDIGTANRIINGTADSTIARNINRSVDKAVPTVSALLAKKLIELK